MLRAALCLLLIKCLTLSAAQGPIPPAVVVVPPTNWWADFTWSNSVSPNIAFYKLYYGVGSRAYTNFLQSITNGVRFNSTSQSDFYFAVTAVNTAGLESDYSSEVSTKGPQNRRVRFWTETSTNILGPWTFFTNISTVVNPPTNSYMRLRTSVEYFY